MKMVRSEELERLLEIEDLARSILDQYGLDDWRFEISNEKTAMGHCFYQKKLITFSSYFAHADMSEIKDTILHEVAHALVGHKHGHDWIWKAKAHQIGAKPERLTDEKSEASYRYILTCPSCGNEWHRYRLRLANPRCGRCEVSLEVREV